MQYDRYIRKNNGTSQGTELDGIRIGKKLRSDAVYYIYVVPKRSDSDNLDIGQSLSGFWNYVITIFC